jgi:ubiquitin C-terminal hydrolase
MTENFELVRSFTYDLLSVVVHQGDLSSGHYTSYSRVNNEVGDNSTPRLLESNQMLVVLLR